MSYAEGVNVHKDGSTINVEVVGAPFVFQGEPHALAVVRDITERKRAEEALRLTQRSVDDSATALLWVRPDGSFMYANDAACQLLGYSRDELQNMAAFDVDPDWSADYWSSEGWDLLKEAGSATVEGRAQRRDGTIIPVEVNIDYLEFEGQEYVFAWVSDITERKRAEEALAESEKKFRAIFDQSPNFVMLVDVDTMTILDVNQTYADYMGYMADEVINVPGKLGFTVPDADALAEVIQIYRDTGRVSDYEFSMITKEGTELHKLVFAESIGIQGKTHQILTIVDITERKRIEEALREAQVELEERVQQRTAELAKANIALRVEIAARMQAEEVLRREGNRAERYLDIAGVMIVALNPRGEITLMNRRGYEILGYEVGELTGRNWFDICLPATVREDVWAVFQRLIAGDIGPAEYYENPVLTRSGQERIITWHNTVVRDGAGHVIGALASGEDITERKRAEEALRESEERYRILVDLAPEIIYLLDPDGRILFANHGVEVLGYAPGDLIGKRFEEIVHPDDRHRVGKGFVERRIGERAIRDLEVRLLAKQCDGQAARCMEAAITMRGLWDVPDDQITQSHKTFLGTLGIARDITERKRAEEALQRAHDELEGRVEERTAELSEANALLREEIAGRRRAEGELTRGNQELMALNAIATTLGQSLDLDHILNATLDTALGMVDVDAGWVQLLDGDDGLLVAHHGLSQDMIEAARAMRLGERMVGPVARTGQPIVIEEPSADLWFSTEAGEGQTLHSFAGVPIEAKDEVLGMLGFFCRFPRQLDPREVQLLTAIGHQIGVAIENARLAEEAADIEILQELNRLRSELIANVSHELRTPLGLIKVFSTTLLRKDASFDHGTQQEFLRSIDQETDKLESIVDNLLDLSRLESSRLNLVKRPTDLGQLAEKVIEAMIVEVSANATSHRFLYDYPTEALVTGVDGRRIEQVLRNLVNNAVKYSPEGGTITLRGRRDNGQILLVVSDQGIGIPAEDQQRVFERFYRVENEITGCTRGAGLGLAVCRGIVEAHGGRIWVESRLGEGSSFYIALPAHPDLALAGTPASL